MSARPSSSNLPKPGEIIAERYRVECVVVGDPPRRRFVATDRGSEQLVEIVELPNHSAVAWASAMTIEHPILATLFATLSRHGASYGVFEQIPGKSLEELLSAGKRFSPASAVSILTSLLDAVARLRRAGVVHGALDPNAVIFHGGDEPDRVKLGYRGPLPDASPFRPPERSPVDPALPGDDLFALSGLLLLLLTGRPPPVGGVYAEQEVRAQGVEDPILRGILAQGLAGDPGRRSERLASLSHPLSVWLGTREAGQQIAPRVSRPSGARSLRPMPKDDPSAPSIEVRASPASDPPLSEAAPSIEVSESSQSGPSIEIAEDHEVWEAPPAEPTTSAPPPVAPESVRPVARTGLGTWLGVSVIAACAIAALVVLGTTGRDAAPHVASVAPPPPAVLASTPARVELPSPAASIATKPPALHRLPTENTAACVVRHLPERSFASVPDMEFLCTTHDPRKGALLLRAALVTASNGLAVTPAMRMWSGLSWYGMAGYAALRAACCPDAPPIELPPAGEGCSDLGPILDEIGKTAARGEDSEPALARFQTAVSCELDQRRAAAFWQKSRPGGAEPTTLRGLLDSVAKPRPEP